MRALRSVLLLWGVAESGYAPAAALAEEGVLGTACTASNALGVSMKGLFTAPLILLCTISGCGADRVLLYEGNLGVSG